MKRVFTRISSVGLCLALLCSILCIAASAQQADSYHGRKYQYYTYLGDSIPWGYGVDPACDHSDPYGVGMRVPGSYTDLVAGVLEENCGTHIQPAASSGSRLIDYRYLLERGMGVPDPYTIVDDWYGMRKPERTARLHNMGPEICSWIKESDLVSVQVGINDITGALVNSAYATKLVDLDRLQNLSDLSSVLSYLQFALDNVAKDPNVAGNLVKTFYSEMSGLFENAAEVVKDVVTVAPDDADILLVGYHKAVKPFRVLPGTHSSLVFGAVDEVLMAFNETFRKLADQYDNVYYVDAPDAEVFGKEGTSAVEILKNREQFLLWIHPDKEGHQYIARCVLDTLNKIH